MPRQFTYQLIASGLRPAPGRLMAEDRPMPEQFAPPDLRTFTDENRPAHTCRCGSDDVTICGLTGRSHCHRCRTTITYPRRYAWTSLFALGYRTGEQDAN